MLAAKADARWSTAIPQTFALWLFMLLVFLPAIIVRHGGDDLTGVLLDCSTILISTSIGLVLFAIFRASVAMAPLWRTILLTASVLAAAAGNTIFDLFFTAWVTENLRESWSSIPVDFTRAAQSMLNYLCVFTVNVALFQLAFSRMSALTRERQLAAAQSAAQQAQLEALRLQLNPHFLFNTLNAISSLIITRRNADAERMTDKLSNFLRSALTGNPTALIKVEDELELIGEYLEIESVRFGDRLHVDMTCAPDARDVRLPGMLIQPLVENAIKYGVAPSRDPVTISIDARVEGDMLCLTIVNDGGDGPLAPKTGGTGVGLKNVRRRLAALFGAAGNLTAGPSEEGYTARICMPAQHDDTPPPGLAAQLS